MVTIYGTTQNKQVKQSVTTPAPKKYGLHFPVGTSPKNNTFNKGYFIKSHGDDLIKNNLKQLLTTIPGERVMLPNFGVDLKKYLFEPLDERTFTSIRRELLTALRQYAPNVEVIKLTVLSSNEISLTGVASIDIKLDCQIITETYEVKQVDIDFRVGV
jgi:phage baseplate assembly protein W